MAKATTIEEAKEQITTLVGYTRKVPQFRINDTIRGEIQQIAAMIETNNPVKAIEVANSVITGLHATLNAFIRNAFVDKTKTVGTETTVISKSHFMRLIEEREGEKYDEDILAGLRSKYTKTLEAVRAETNGTFENRVEAYNSLNAAVIAADEDQKNRDRKRQVIAEANRRRVKDNADAEATERNRVQAQTERQKLLERRKLEADAFRNLI